MVANINSPTSPKRVTALMREQSALKLRMSGATFEDIGKSLNITKQAAHAAVLRALKKANEKLTEDAIMLRELEMHRLDRLFMGIYKDATAGSFGAIDRAIKIMERRAKMMGLDIPTAVANVDIDFSKLSNEQLDRIAAGENPLHVLGSDKGDSREGTQSQDDQDRGTENTDPPNG